MKRRSVNADDPAFQPNLSFQSFASIKQSPLVHTTEDAGAPKDKLKLAYYSYMFLGMGVLYPWNCFLTALDYFFVMYPDRPIDRMFTIVYFPSNLLFLTICTFGHKYMNLNLRINSGYTLFIVAVLIPILTNYVVLDGAVVGTAFTYALTLFGACVAGVGDGVAQGAVFAHSATLPPEYVQSVSTGTALAGVLVFALRCGTKAGYGDTPEGLRDGAMVFYFISLGLCVACLLLFAFALMRLPIVAFYRGKGSYSQLEDEEASVQMATIGEGDAHSTPPPLKAAMAAPYFPALVITSRAAITTITFVRLAFIPLFIWLKSLANGWLMLAADLLFGISNGYVTTVALMAGAIGLAPEDQEIVTNLLVLCLIFGLAVGSVLSWLWLIPGFLAF